VVIRHNLLSRRRGRRNQSGEEVVGLRGIGKRLISEPTCGAQQF